MVSGKKAMTAGFLVTLIIIILSFVLLAGTIARFMSKAEDKQTEALCRDSVAFRAATALRADNAEAKLAPMLCKTQDKKISGDKTAVKKEFADKMARCWQMFGEGKYESSIFDNTNVFGSKSRCFVCYSLLVEESGMFKKEDSISSEEFAAFLRDEKYPKRADIKYLDYFQFGGGPGFVMAVLTNEGITPGRGYAVAYKAGTDECKLCSILAAGGSGASVVGGLTIWGVGLTTAGVGLVAGGLAALGLGAGYGYNDLFGESTDIDGIMVVDLGQETLQNAFTSQCVQVTDIAGK